MKYFLFLILFIIHHTCCWAQGEDNVWIFGDSLKLDFNSGNPVLTSSRIYIPHGGSASVCDANGQLLFYSDGNKVWDRNYNVMPNGQLDNQNFFATRQNTIIIPYPGNPGKYFLFMLGGVYTNGWIIGGTLKYSVIDMALNGGSGDVVAGQNSILIDSGYTGGLAATSGDRCNIWLVSRKLSEYHVYEITADGIHTTPVVSTFSNLPQQNSLMVLSCIKFSPDGTKMIAYTGENWQSNQNVKLYKFNKSTGMLSDQKLLLNNSVESFEFVFSPDGSKLYISAMPLPMCHGDCRALIQFDLSLPSLNAIINSRTILTPIWAGVQYFGIKTASNGKVYAVGPPESAYYIPGFPYDDSFGIYEIAQPDLAGTACGFNPIPVFPAVKRSFVFPNETFGLYYDTLSRVALDTTVCTQNNHFPVVNLKVPTGYDQYTWDDGRNDTLRQIQQQGTYWVRYRKNCTTIIDTIIVRGKDIFFSLGNDTVLCRTHSLELSVPFPDAAVQWQDFSTAHKYTVERSGKYWATLTQDGCNASDTITIEIKNIAQYLGNDTTICHGIPFQLQLNANTTPDATVRWNNYSQDNTIQVTSPGAYWVTVSDFPCLESDTISISSVYCGCNFIVPNAFSPNGDGANDHFLPSIESGCPVSDYTLNIYNRFGERVFSSFAPGMGWNGTYKGNPAETGTYFYELRFKGGSEGTDNYRKGDLVLLR